MGRSVDNSRYGRISREVNRLEKILSAVPEGKRRLTKGLVERAAFLRIEIEDLEADLNDNGSIEEYQSSVDVPPITRIRAAAQHYEKMAKQYLAVCKQLADLIPAQEGAGGGKGGANKDNPFEALVARRIRRVK